MYRKNKYGCLMMFEGQVIMQYIKLLIDILLADL